MGVPNIGSPPAADDFATSRARVEELRREAEREKPAHPQTRRAIFFILPP